MTKRFDVYQRITDTILAAIAAGTGQFQLPWHRPALNVPRNARTGKTYRGVNVLHLWSVALDAGHISRFWGTYRQWRDLGAQVRKGEKGVPVLFFKRLGSLSSSSSNDNVPSSDAPARKLDEPAGDEAHEPCRLVLRWSFVFNADQVEGFNDPEAPRGDSLTLNDSVQAFIEHSTAEIVQGGARACYQRSADRILIPEPHLFTGTDTSSAEEAYYATLFHELIHWTGAPNRLNRLFGERFGDDAYAMEELVADLGAAFLCAEFGISSTPRPDHAAYLSSWLNVLKADKRAIVTAASLAGKAVDFLLDDGRYRELIAESHSLSHLRE